MEELGIINLSNALLSKEQVEEFSYNINFEIIENYISNHQGEYEKWKEELKIGGE